MSYGCNHIIVHGHDLFAGDYRRPVAATPMLPAITTAITKENATAEYVKLRTDIQSL